jgi:serine-type D-Ala-D-Ala endopeptidase (penicillin-binding protein 7)
MPMSLERLFARSMVRVSTRISSVLFGAALVCAVGAIGVAQAAAASTSPAQPTPVTHARRAPHARTATSTTKSVSVRRSRRASRYSTARAARARALWLEAQTPRYKLDDAGTLVPDIRAAAAIIYNPDNGQVLWEENSQDKRSIASITKVMTASVFLEQNPDLTREVVIERGDVFGARHTYLHANDHVTVDDLLHLTLIASDNAAARALARVSTNGTGPFVVRMNEKAAELGLDNTTYADPSGLDPLNMSSAYDMARLIASAASDDRIASVMRSPYYTFRTRRGPLTVHSTNQLVMKGDVDVRGGKTGFIAKAGYCLATLLRLPQTGQQVAVVVLGARSNAGRFMETRHLFNWLSSKAPDFFKEQEPAAVDAQPQ